MANSAALHEALRTEVVDRYGVSDLNLVLVRLQRSKTDITFSLHAEPTSLNVSGRFMSAHLLELIGFSVGDCAFVERRKCRARGVQRAVSTPLRQPDSAFTVAPQAGDERGRAIVTDGL